MFAESLNLKASNEVWFKESLLGHWSGFIFNDFAGVYTYGKSQICPKYAVNCLKKELSLGIHSCRSCGYSTERYMTVAQVRK